MLNRRKQPLDSDGQACEERVGLLDSPDIYEPIPTRNHSLDAPITNITVSILPKKVRDKSPEPRAYRFASSNHHIPRLSNQSRPINQSTSQQQPGHWQSSYSNNQGDSYELNRVNSSTQARAVISITGNDSYYKHPVSDFILYTIQPGDTLHNLSVKYHCPVATIKRLNNLWSDRDFYGLSKLKLPVGKLGLLADVLKEEGKSTVQTDSRSESELFNLDNSDPGCSNHVASGPLGQATDTRTSPKRVDTVTYLQDDNSTGTLLHANSIFKNLDHHIERAREAAKSYDSNANDIMQTLAQSGNLVGDDQDRDVAAEMAEKLPDLSDFGLSYNFLVLFIFIVCLVCPLAYVIYHEETNRDSHHHDNLHHIKPDTFTTHEP